MWCVCGGVLVGVLRGDEGTWLMGGEGGPVAGRTQTSDSLELGQIHSN